MRVATSLMNCKTRDRITWGAALDVESEPVGALLIDVRRPGLESRNWP